MPRKKTKEARFWAKVDKQGPVVRVELGPCWIWTGGKDRNGYGRLASGPQGGLVFEYAHRLAFLFQYGKWPEPCALHRCDNLACVRWEHLFEGTRGDNLRDCKDKGRYREPKRRKGEENGNSKLTAEIVQEIRASRLSGVDVAKAYGITQSTVSSIRLRQTWRDVS